MVKITLNYPLSDNKVRNIAYTTLLEACDRQEIDVQKITYLGCRLMRQAKVHPHFFGNNSLFENALYLVLFVLDIPYKNFDETLLKKTIETTQAKEIIKLFERRIFERVPVEYLTQESYYFGNKFYVNEHVLVPRSVMSSRFSDFLNRVPWENYRVLDLCTGSGCIGITLALLNRKITVDLSDVSTEALMVAQKNINFYSLEDRIRIIQSNLFENISEKYDLIITNPPYVSDKEYQSCPIEFKKEPIIALKAGKQGLDIIRKILFQAKEYLNPQGLLIAEVGHTVTKLLKSQYSKIPFQWFNYKKSVGPESLIEKFIRITGYLDNTFICQAKDLPESNLLKSHQSESIN